MVHAKFQDYGTSGSEDFKIMGHLVLKISKGLVIYMGMEAILVM